jgi:hypothetical protein
LSPLVSDSAPVVASPVAVVISGISRLKSGAKPLAAVVVGLPDALLPAIAWQDACDACFAADGWRKNG